ncbi:MAG: DUF366 family protein [Armatimonadetes bacterium]|nr:DUF366 family protein [Armatimonadota bacterium]
MHTLYHLEELAYTGAELRSHWIMERFGLRGDAMVAFRGPCDVALSEMVDLEDVAAGASIRSAEMLHFIAEHFESDLERMVLRQRLFMCMVREALSAREGVPDLRRDGDDLYAGGRKLSVSIATASPVSTLMHVGLNVDPTGAPVAAVGLAEWGVDPDELARELLDAYAAELAGVAAARCKVRGVR